MNENPEHVMVSQYVSAHRQQGAKSKRLTATN